jgi:hypothetical protein
MNLSLSLYWTWPAAQIVKITFLAMHPPSFILGAEADLSSLLAKFARDIAEAWSSDANQSGAAHVRILSFAVPCFRAQPS